jgi:hypothetical protein
MSFICVSVYELPDPVNVAMSPVVPVAAAVRVALQSVVFNVHVGVAEQPGSTVNKRLTILDDKTELPPRFGRLLFGYSVFFIIALVQSLY